MDKEIQSQLYDPKKYNTKTIIDILVDGKPFTSMVGMAAVRFAKLLRKQGHKVKLVPTSEEYKYDLKKKRKSSWLNFVMAHKNIKLPNGRINIKAISKLYHAKSKAYDPAHVRHGAKITVPRWFEAMVQGIKTRSDVQNPFAIVEGIWNRLSPSKRLQIKRREAQGKPFKYDLPLPDDRATHGIGTLRMVKPFKLAEVQVNLSVRDYLAALKSGLFQKMKRGDGTTALVARCKSDKKNCNIFVDKDVK